MLRNIDLRASLGVPPSPGLLLCTKVTTHLCSHDNLLVEVGCHEPKRSLNPVSKDLPCTGTVAFE